MPSGMINITDEDDLKAAKTELRYSNPEYIQRVTFGSVYDESPMPPRSLWALVVDPAGKVYVPRSWYCERVIAGKSRQIPVATSEVEVEFPEPRLSPLPHQERALQSFIDLVKARDRRKLPTDAYIKLPPSEGKTILGMLIAYCCGLKTLVVVPTQEIEAAWVSDCCRVFGITPDKIGKIRGKKLVIGEHITVGSTQTLMNLDPSSWSTQFGLTIFDEVHRVSSTRFSEVAKESSSIVRLGLTATDYRKDGTFQVVKHHLGSAPVFSTDTRTNSVPLHYHVVHTGVGMRGGKEDYTFQALTNDLLENKVRNKLLLGLVNHVMSLGGDILIVSPRTEYLEWLHGRLTSLGHSVALITGSTQNRESLYSDIKGGKYRITVATTSIVSEGASNPRWVHLINTAPFSDKKLAIQLSGRVIRKMAGKDAGHMWDLVDDNPMASKMADKRLSYIRPIVAELTYFRSTDPNKPVHQVRSII